MNRNIKFLSRTFSQCSRLRSAEARTVAGASAGAAVEKAAEPGSVSQVFEQPDIEQINERSISIIEQFNSLSKVKADELFDEIKRTEIDKDEALSAKFAQLDSELKTFFGDFVGNEDKFSHSSQTAGSASLHFEKHPFLEKSSTQEPYTDQELYLRREFRRQNLSLLGSVVSKNVYHPFKDLYKPMDYKDVTVEHLLAAEAHLGQSTSLWRSSTQPYIYGEYKGIHIIDLEQTLVHLRRAAKVVEGIAEQGGVIVFLGTRQGQQRATEVMAEKCNGFFVSAKWIPGTITNGTEVSKGWHGHEVDLSDKPTGTKLPDSVKTKNLKPDLLVVLNPTENRCALLEAANARVPTIGIIDTDSEPSLVTYPIPANDDSIRTINFISGILGRAGETGRKRRVLEHQRYLELQNGSS